MGSSVAGVKYMFCEKRQYDNLPASTPSPTDTSLIGAGHSVTPAVSLPLLSPL